MHTSGSRADGRRVVVAGAVARAGHLLAARRTRPVALAGGWELPGGKVEPGEDPAQALVRELREELDLDVELVGVVPGPDAGDWPLDDTSVLRVLRARPTGDGEPVPGVAHDECRWLAPDDGDSVGWLDADRAPAAAAMAALGTVVTYPAGGLAADARIRRCVPYGEHVAVVTDRTPFHPVDDRWPDQPADAGTVEGRPVLDVRLGAVDDAGALLVGPDIDVRRGDPARSWVVAHVMATPDAPPAGALVRLEVDTARRAALSRGHTACHLAALAMNEACAELWGKDGVRRDSRGHPDLDQLAIQASRIEPDGSYDRYRFGRSARKAGLDTAGLAGRVGELRDAAQALLDAWTAGSAAVRIDTGGDPTLSARRIWVCELPGGPARIPCGGTHVGDLTELGAVRLTWTETPDEPGLEVRVELG